MTAPARIFALAVAALALAVAALALAVAAPASVAAAQPSGKSGTRPSRTATPPRPAAGPVTSVADPVREAYLRASAPTLGDSSRVRLRAFIARWPRHPLAREAWLELGTLAYAQGEYGEARDDFRRARGGAIADRARIWEARASLALGVPHDARSLAQPIARAKRGTAFRWDAGEIVALSLMSEGKRAAALSSYRALLDAPPGDSEPAALFQAIELAEEAGANEDAREWRAKLVSRYPRSPEAASTRATAAETGGTDRSAREAGPSREPRPSARDARTDR